MPLFNYHKFKNRLKYLLGYQHEEALLLHRSALLVRRLKPQVFIIGAQKGGTTALTAYLNNHPSIAAPYRKEISYYDESYKKGLNYYKPFFPPRWRNKNNLTYDATPSYLSNVNVPSRIANDNPSAKFIICVRSPTERLKSHYTMAVKNGWEELPLEAALLAESSRIELIKKMSGPMPEMWISRYSYYNNSLYGLNIKNWLKHFSSEQFFIIDNDEMKNDPETLFPQLFRFLELPINFDEAFLQQDLRKTIFSHKDVSANEPVLPPEVIETLETDFHLFRSLTKDFQGSKTE